MEIREFAEIIREEMERRTDCVVSVQEVRKNNNVTLHGISIKEPDCNIAPTIYLESYFEDYENGRSIDSIISSIFEIVQAEKMDKSMDMDWFRDFGKVRDKVRFKLVNYEANKELLKKVPHTRYLDLAKVYYVVVESENFGSGTILVYDSHMKLWGVTAEQLETIAVENTCNKQSVMVHSMNEVLVGLVGNTEELDIPPEHQLFVVSNPSKCFGAASMCHREALKELAEMLESDLIILPSSVHEIIVKPTSGEMEELLYCKDMVHEVNRTQVSAEEFLSNSVYFYNRETNTLSIA